MIGRPGLAWMNFLIQPSMSTLPSPMFTQRTAMPFGHLPDGAVAHVAGLGVGNQHLERHVRILEHPHRVARVEADAHDVGADRLDHHLHLARLQVAAVVLHGQLHARVDDARAEAADGLDHVVDVHLDLRPLGIAAEDAAHALRAEDLRRLECPRHLLFERAELRVERPRARAHRAVRQLQLDARAGRRARGSAGSPLRRPARPAAARSSPTSA